MNGCRTYLILLFRVCLFICIGFVFCSRLFGLRWRAQWRRTRNIHIRMNVSVRQRTLIVEHAEDIYVFSEGLFLVTLIPTNLFSSRDAERKRNIERWGRTTATKGEFYVHLIAAMLFLAAYWQNRSDGFTIKYWKALTHKLPGTYFMECAENSEIPPAVSSRVLCSSNTSNRISIGWCPLLWYKYGGVPTASFLLSGNFVTQQVNDKFRGEANVFDVLFLRWPKDDRGRRF